MTFAAYIRTYRGQQIVILGLAGLCIALGFAVFGMSVALRNREQAVVLVPPAFEGPVTVSRSGASDDYKRAWALFVAQTLGNVTPANVLYLRGALEPLLDAAIFTDVVARLEEEAEKVRRDRLTIRFEPRRVLIDQRSGRIFVNGLSVVETLVGDTQRAPKTYEMAIDVRGYRPRIDALNAYEGEPRTAAWHARQHGASRRVREAD